MIIEKLPAFFLAIVLFGGVTSVAQEQSADKKVDSEANVSALKDGEQLFWIFLTTGKSSAGVANETIEEMQSAHLANFKVLAEQKKLLTAGPMTDPEKRMRGIVVVRAKNRQEVRAMFKDDPYVQQGYLNVEATEMDFEYGTLNTRITPDGLEEFRLVMLEKNGSASEDPDRESQEENQSYIAEMSTEKDMLLTVFLPKQEFNRTAILIMAKGENDDAINEKVSNIPAVKNGAWKSRIFPLRMGKGTLTKAG